MELGFKKKSISTKLQQPLLHSIFIQYLEKDMSIDAYIKSTNAITADCNGMKLNIQSNILGGFSPKEIKERNIRNCRAELDLRTAAKDGDVNGVRSALERADVNAKNNNGDTALIIASASYKESVEVVKLLLAKGADVNAKNNNGKTALINASDNKSVKVVQLLLAKGADENAKKNNGDTALIIATYNESVEVVQMLLEKGAHVNAKNNQGCTALIHACSKNILTIAEAKVNLDLVKLLLEKGSDVNITSDPFRNSNGETALMEASYEGNLEVVKLLLEKRTENRSGWIALMYAITKGHLEMAKLLMVKMLGRGGIFGLLLFVFFLFSRIFC